MNEHRQIEKWLWGIGLTFVGGLILVPPQGVAAQQQLKRKAGVVAPKATPAPAPVSKSASNQRALDMQKSATALPQGMTFAEPVKTHTLEAVKPPRSNSFYEGGGKEAEYEHLLDEEIKTLYRLSQQNKMSPNRGEIWLRLGERYVEKARLIDIREQAEYEKRLKEFAEKKTKVRPQLNTKEAKEYNEKAVQLYDWFIKDFPTDKKVDQALFFLGYNHFELGNSQKGEFFYNDLVRRFPESVFVTESHFALGEYYFENEKWREALENYAKVIKVKKARLNTFALYKSAWCLYRLNRTNVSLQALEKVIRQSRMNEADDGGGSGRKTVNKLRLAQEALKDYVPFYAEVGKPEDAYNEFLRLSGNDKTAAKMVERLSYIYTDNGNRDASTKLFKQLISLNPTSEKAAEYQYQCVLAHANHDPKEFRKELEAWLEGFGPQSAWAKENAKNKKMVEDVAHLQETTLRNYVLVQHQAAQNAHTSYAQQLANYCYGQYFRYFSDSPKVIEMRFFHAELLFDMERHEDAAKTYIWVSEKDPKGPYREKAIVNALLALEKDLPTPQQIEAKRGQSVERIAFDPPVQRFEKAVQRFLAAFPKGAKTNSIKRRMAVLDYSYNHFDEALELFEQIIRDDPKSDDGIIAGNLTLDIYKLRNDMDGLSKKAQEFLAIPQIAHSKFGDDIRVILAKAGYLRAEKIADSGDALKAAKEFEAFAAANKQSELAAAARYKAAVNYEKAGDLISATRMHNLVMMTPSSDPKIKEAQNDSRNALSKIYQQTGQLEAAARQYQSYAAANAKDPKGINSYYNAGVLWDALGETDQAAKAYNIYFEKSQKADRVEVIYAEAEMYYRRGQKTKATYYYDQYLSKGAKSQTHALRATYQIAHIADISGSTKKAKIWFKKVLETFQQSKKEVRDEGARYAAEARFYAAQDTLHELLSIQFGRVDKDQAAAAIKVKKLQAKYIAEMKEVIRFDNGAFIVAALASSGKMFDSLADMFNRIPAPKGYKPEEVAAYRELIQKQVNGFRGEAKNSYKAAVDKAREFEVYSTWSKLALMGVKGVGDANSSESSEELTSDSRTIDWMGL